MLLAIDIGNSHSVFGVFEKNKLQFKELRVETEKHKTSAYYLPVFQQINQKTNITAVAISSVVLELDEIFTSLTKKLFQTTPVFVSTELVTNITNLSKQKSHLGADRLCDIVYAIDRTEGNRIVVDLGTATKFEVISKTNEYLGGAIAPGVGDSFRSLLSHASKLPELTLSEPKKVVGGFHTKEHLDSGFVYGFASLVDGMIDRILTEQDWNNATIFLTGGYSSLIKPKLSHHVIHNTILTLEGINLLWKINKKIG